MTNWDDVSRLVTRLQNPWSYQPWVMLWALKSGIHIKTDTLSENDVHPHAHPNCYFNMPPNRNFHGGNDEKPSNFGAPYPIPKQTM